MYFIHLISPVPSLYLININYILIYARADKHIFECFNDFLSKVTVVKLQKKGHVKMDSQGFWAIWLRAEDLSVRDGITYETQVWEGRLMNCLDFEKIQALIWATHWWLWKGLYRSKCEAARWGWGWEGSHRTQDYTKIHVRDSREVTWQRINIGKGKFKVGGGSDALNFNTLFLVQPSGTVENGYMLCSLDSGR